MLFKDRTEAGRLLADHLVQRRLTDPIVLALPRGGVPVGYEVAERLNAPLDIVLVRKIGAPWHRELALGAIADGDHPDLVTNEAIQAELRVSDDYLQQEAARQLQEIERRRRLYLGGRAALDVAGRTAILVDDGIATGATVRAALRSTRRRRPESIILAVPVAPPDTLDALAQEADHILCLHKPAYFAGVGQFYDDFAQVDDATVTALLEKRAKALSSPRNAAPRGKSPRD